MRVRLVQRCIMCASVLTVLACKSATAPPIAPLTTTSPDSNPADEVASITGITLVYSGGNPRMGSGTPDPADTLGYEVRLVIQPGSSVNGGLEMSLMTPTFVRDSTGKLIPARASDLRVGDTIEFWTDGTYTTGAGGFPPTARLYTPSQIAIDR